MDDQEQPLKPVAGEQPVLGGKVVDAFVVDGQKVVLEVLPDDAEEEA
jgi:hypothetical protein